MPILKLINQVRLIYFVHVHAYNKIAPLTDDSKYVYGLCFNKDGSTLVFLQNDTDVPYPQRNCLQVWILNFLRIYAITFRSTGRQKRLASLQKTLINQQVSSRDYSIILCSFQTCYALSISYR